MLGSCLWLAAPAQAQAPVELTKTGHVLADSLYKLFYVPIEVPAGTREIRVQESYTHPGKNVLNMGIYDPRGYQAGNSQGFRGWSGGAKTAFFLNAQAASTGYVPGPVGAGHVARAALSLYY